MKTLSINPLNLKPQVKKLLHRPEHVEMPGGRIKNYELIDKLLTMRSSLDYMATNYGIEFDFRGFDDNCPFVQCKKRNFETASEYLKDSDTDAEIAEKIYKAVSKVL